MNPFARLEAFLARIFRPWTSSAKTGGGNWQDISANKIVRAPKGKGHLTTPTPTPTPTPTVVLSELTLTGGIIPEGTVAGNFVGAIVGITPGSTLQLSALDVSLGFFEISGGNLITGPQPTNYEAATFHNVSITETLGDVSKTSIIPVVVSNVLELTLTDLSGTFTLAENAAAGAIAGALSGVTPGSNLSLFDSAGNQLAVIGNNIVRGSAPVNFEGQNPIPFTVREANSDATNSPHDTVLSCAVTNVFEQPTLVNLQFSASSFVVGVPASGTILGAAAGSTIVATGIPSGLAINGTAHTWNWNGSGSASSGSFTLTETLSDSPNSPHASTVSYSISATSSSTITQTSTSGTAPFTFDFSDPVHGEGVTLYWEVTNTASPTYDANGFFTTTVTQSGIDFISGEDYANLDNVLPNFSTWSGAGSIHVAPCIDNDAGAFTGPDGATYDRFPFSNTLSDTITASVATFASTTGPDKFSGITLFNSNLSAYAAGNYGSCGVSATLAAVNSKFWLEWRIDSQYDGSGPSLGCGFFDGSLDLSAQMGALPGAASGPNGCSFNCRIGDTSVAYARNGISGGGNNWTLPGGISAAAGDALHFEVDQVAHTVLVKFWDASTSTSTTLGTLTLTSQIPSQWVFFGRAGKGHAGVPSTSDGFTANFGGSSPLIAATGGYGIYA
jgi:hypothetical protein